MRRLIDGVAHRLIEFIAALPDQPAADAGGGDAVRALLDEPPPEEGTPPARALDLLFSKVVPCSLETAGPGYLAYIPGGGLFTAALGEFAAAIVNRYVGVFAAAPGAAELEAQVIRWMAELLGMSPSAFGVLTTGGSMSTLMAVIAAREKILGDDTNRGTVYVSTEVHHVVTRAARIAGIAARQIRIVPADAAGRLKTEALRDIIAADRTMGFKPFFVCGSAGTVNSGAVDPLHEIADIAREGGLWFHVDGAYGAMFRLVPELAPVLAGMERCDSLAADPHKGLFLAYGTGLLLVRDQADLRRAFEGGAAYLPPMQEDGRRVDFCELSPELSRDWRGLRLWLPFKLHGVAAFRAALAEKRELAVLAHERLAAEPDVEIPAPPALSLFAFRQVPKGLDPARADDHNRDLLGRINAPRRILITGTEIDGDFYLRFCVLHLRTHRERVEEGLAIIARELERGRRPS